VDIGITPGYLGADGALDGELELAVEAERLGFASYWVGEPYGHEAVAILAWVAGATSTLGLGSCVLAMPGRTPAMTAQAAATLDMISGGRLRLGLGLSGPQVSEGWHGVPFDRPLERTRDYVAVVRAALRREVVRYEGETLQLPLREGHGKALKLILKPLRADVPILLAALGARSVALAGEIADGWIPLWYSPEHAATLHAPYLAGAARAGRAPGRLVPMVPVHIDDDVTAAIDALRPVVALYVGGMGSRTSNFYNSLIASYGYEDAARACQDRYLDGDVRGAIAVVPDALVDEVCLAGPEGRVAERIDRYRAAGVDTLIAFLGAGDKLGQVRRLAKVL
jgi:F420-dependent oxidoreductase-like protein